MPVKNWIQIVDEHIGNYPPLGEYRSDVLAFFEKALENDVFPEKTWFGFPPVEESIGIMFGFYIAQIYKKKVFLLSELNFVKTQGNSYIPVKADPHNDGLVLIEARVEELKTLTANDKVWEHYRQMTLEAEKSRRLSAVNKKFIENKHLVQDVYPAK